MRFNILVTFLFLTLASGLVVPPGSRRRGDVYARQLLLDDVVENDARSPSILTGLVKVAPKAFGAAKNAVKSITNMVKGTGKVAAGKAKAEAKKVGGAVKRAGKDVAAKAKVAATNAGKKAKGVATNAGKKIRGSASKAGKKVKGAAGKAEEKLEDARSGIKNKYTVPAGGGKPARTYTKNDVKQSVSDANTEHQALQAPGVSNRRRRQSALRDFGNNNHHLPRPDRPGPNSLPKVRSKKLKEYPLRTSAEIAANPRDKGPARVIMKENKKGVLKFKGVVAHDQSRAPGTPGVNDHFQVKGTRK